MRIGYNNAIIEDQLSSSSPLSTNYIITNVLEQDTTEKYISLNSGSINISFRDNSQVGVGNAQSITASMCVINAHNMQSGDTATLKGYSTETGSTPSVTYNFTYQSYGMAIIFTEGTYFWELDLSVANYVEIGNIFLGTHLITPDYEIGAVTTHRVTDKYTKSKSGQLRGDEGYFYRTANFLFPHMDIETGEVDDWIDFFETVGTIQPFYLLKYPDAQDIEKVFYCHRTSKTFKLEEHKKNREMYIDVPLSIEEIY